MKDATQQNLFGQFELNQAVTRVEPKIPNFTIQLNSLAQSKKVFVFDYVGSSVYSSP